MQYDLPPLFLSTYSRWSLEQSWRLVAGAVGLANNAQPSANNKACYVPVKIPMPYPVKRVFTGTGVLGSGNMDWGIYTSAGTRLFSNGSVAQGAGNTLKYSNWNILLEPGVYYFAVAMTSTGGTVMGSGIGAQNCRAAGILEELVYPLPATMTPVAPSASQAVPFIGITITESGFIYP